MTDPEPTETPGLAVAWTRSEVQVEWQFDGRPRRDWINADCVRRRGEPRPAALPRRALADGLPYIDTRRRPRP